MDKGRTCVVGGYPCFADDLDLSKAFSRFGSIQTIKLERDERDIAKPHCFITFRSRREMLAAVRGMDGKTLIDGLPESEFFTDELAELSSCKLIVRPGTKLFDFIRECFRCGHVGHAARECNATDPLLDPGHQFKGRFEVDEASLRTVYIMTEEDWPFNPPGGYSKRLYQEAKRLVRASDRVLRIPCRKTGKDEYAEALRAELAHIFEREFDEWLWFIIPLRKTGRRQRPLVRTGDPEVDKLLPTEETRQYCADRWAASEGKSQISAPPCGVTDAAGTFLESEKDNKKKFSKSWAAVAAAPAAVACGLQH